MPNPVRKGGGGKRLCTPFIFPLTLKFHSILFSDNYKQHCRSEKEGELLKDGEAIGSDDQPFVSEASPSCKVFARRRFPPCLSCAVSNGQMRGYQSQDLRWMISLRHIRLLADDMGLGKALQTISFVASLKLYHDISGSWTVSHR